MAELTIDNFTISDDSDAFVIAEIGHNHQGSTNLCRDLFDAAKWAGCNAVKLQKRDNKSLYAKEFYDAPYNSEHAFGRTYGEHREALEFGWDEYNDLIDYADHLGLTFIATAFDIPSAEFLADLEISAIKIASGDLTNRALLKHVSTGDQAIILSTGGGSLEEVEAAVDLCNPDAILQCTSCYPCKPKDLNLKVITAFQHAFDCVIGLSSHENGIAMPVLAYALGARIIEKNFTLDRTMKGTDQAFSLEPSGMKKMVRDLKRAREALGNGFKRRLEAENEPLKKQEKNQYGKVDGLGRTA